MKLLLDTNFIIDCVRFKIDLHDGVCKLEENEGKIELFIPFYCIEELKAVRNVNAKIALELLKRVRIIDIEKTASTDLSLLDYAKEHEYAVATNDRGLLERLEKNGVKAVRIRQR